jgi:Ser/Thr protein kinase RdoA (MazF antagonist)
MLPDPVAEAWSLRADSARPLGSGLINRTFLAEDRTGALRVVQQVNPIFPPAVNEDIDRVTRHLEARGLPTPRIVPTADGHLWIPGGDDRGAWRVLTYHPGRSLESLGNAGQAASAGSLLGRFHRALDGYAHAFRSARPPIHELGRHLAALETALEDHARHPAYPRVAPLAAEILAAARRLDPLPVTTPRVVHGDPKINNVLFHPDRDEALCLVDLDTVGRMALPLELGDALRSWCNPGGEDKADSRFCVSLFEAAVRGYGAETRDWVTAEEIEAMVPVTATIQVELAARFCADALNESYFGWDPARFPTRGEHNRVRAAGQLAVHRSLLLQKRELEQAVRAAFPGS